MQYYIGVKQVQAEPEEGARGEAGYAILYPDGYRSWSPRDVFERAYLPMGHQGDNVTEEMATWLSSFAKISRSSAKVFLGRMLQFAKHGFRP